MKVYDSKLTPVIFFIIGFAVSYFLFPQKEVIKREPVVMKSVVTDTIFKVIYKDPIVVNKAKANVVRVRTL